ncbi:MAG: GAF domain-containing protein [Proteobacteria bacterium]|nr:GAF domain-containing protein [Pseudomonadota bacterium]NIS70860.1 GAF domain-containing protein [Pseudomonadota bacterium]
MLPAIESSGGLTHQSGPRELDLLYRISEVVPSVDTSRERFLRAMEILDETFGTNYATLTLLSPSNKEIILEVAFGEPTRDQGCIQGPNSAIIRQVIARARPMAFNRINEVPLRFPPSSLNEKALSLLCVPIMNRSQSVGVISTHPIYRDTVSYDKDIRLLTVIACMILQNPPLQGDDQLEAKETRGSLPLDKILDTKLRQMIEKVDPRTESRCALLLDIVSLVEKIVIKWALKRHQNVQTATALFLGINRNTLRKKLRDLNIHI